MKSFHIVDVFSDRPFGGAQVSVFPDATDIDPDCRTALAGELNTWATVFVEPLATRRFAMASYTRTGEVAFGSHAAVGCAAALAATGAVDVPAAAPLTFESRDGPVAVHVEPGRNGGIRALLARRVPRNIDTFTPAADELSDILGIPINQRSAAGFRPLFANVDHNYLVVPAPDCAAVRRAQFNARAWAGSAAPGMATWEILLYSRGSSFSSADFHARLLGPHIGAVEDPPVGGAVPALVVSLCAHDHVRGGTHTFTVERGDPGTRVSTIEVEMDNRPGDEIAMRVGGQAVVSVRGEVL